MTAETYIVGAAGGQRIAIAATLVEAIVKLGPVTRIPRAPRHIAGLCAVRSTVLTAVDVARSAGLDRAAEGAEAAIVLHGGHRYALRLDAVEDVEAVAATPVPTDDAIGPRWRTLGPARVETKDGTALVLDIGAAIAGPSRD